MRPARPNRLFQSAFWIDRWVGPVLCAVLAPVKLLRSAAGAPPAAVGSSTAGSPAAGPQRILLLKFWGLGSIVLASALIRELHARHPDAAVDFVTLRENERLLAGIPEIRRCISVDLSGGIVRFLASTFRAISAARRERYDLVLDLEFFTNYSALFAFLTRARESRGFDAQGRVRGALHDVRLPFNSYNHVVLNFLSLLHGNPVEPLPLFDVESAELPPLAVSAAVQRTLDAKLTAHPSWRNDAPLVVLNPNTGELALERRWPLENVAGFLEKLRRVPDLNIALTGTSGEAGFVGSVIRTAGAEEHVLNLAGVLDFDEFLALLHRADVLVTNDSGPLHLASAVGTSTVALFGPETPVLYGPLRSRPSQEHRVHYRRLACSPCMNVHNNKVLSCWFAEAACMSGIAAEDVLASTLDLLPKSLTE